MINPRDDIRVEFDSFDYDLPGWPGYRTRPGRSGYDPLDAPFERAQFVGRVTMSLIRQDWHTDNLFYLALLNLFGFLTSFVALFFVVGIILPWLNPILWIGFRGLAGILGFVLVNYLVIGLGFREIDAILDDEND